MGGSPPNPECFTLGVGDGDLRYSYHTCHIVFEFDQLMAILDREKPQVIVNFVAQGESATSFEPEDWWFYYETNCAALSRLTGKLQSRDYLERFIHIGTSELYGS